MINALEQGRREKGQKIAEKRGCKDGGSESSVAEMEFSGITLPKYIYIRGV